MYILGQVHLAAAVASLASGAAVLLMSPKGTRRHRQIGWVYVASMLAANATALMIYRLFGGFGPFHFFAIISLLGIAGGVRAALRAKSSRMARDLAQRAIWVGKHYHFMAWSYAGLCAAAVSEAATRIPAFRPRAGGELIFGLAVAAATSLAMVTGAYLIRTRRLSQLAQVGIKP